jgi:hypothetical protein
MNCSLDFSKRRGKRMIKMSQYKDFGSFNLSNEGFVLVSELLWSK